MAKQGVWGERTAIITPILYKRVTCATCTHYSHEDHSCLISPVVPRIDGFDFWKHCKDFKLSLEYYDDNHKRQVIREKGENFFKGEIKKEVDICSENGDLSQNRNAEKEQENRKSINSSKSLKNFSDRFIYSVRENHGIAFSEIDMPEFPGFSNTTKCFVNNHDKIIVITLSHIKMPQTLKGNANRELLRAKRWTEFSNTILSVISIFGSLVTSEEYDRWILIPVIRYKEDKSYGEEFYYTKGKELHGIKLVEMDDSGNLLFATGPIKEKYWTGEKIKNLQVFKK